MHLFRQDAYSVQLQHQGEALLPLSCWGKGGFCTEVDTRGKDLAPLPNNIDEKLEKDLGGGRMSKGDTMFRPVCAISPR